MGEGIQRARQVERHCETVSSRSDRPFVVYDPDQIPLPTFLFENQPKAPPIHPTILGIEPRKMILHDNPSRVNIVNIVEGITAPQDHVIVADLLHPRIIMIVDKATEICLEGQSDRVT